MGKDKITIYMFRNILGTFTISLSSFVLSFLSFYHCSLAEAMQRVFIFDRYTLLYFILIWVFDYLVFEISKILYDSYEKKVTFIPIIGLLVIGILSFFIPFLDLFQYNLSFLCLLIVLRIMKQLYKKRPKKV